MIQLAMTSTQEEASCSMVFQDPMMICRRVARWEVEATVSIGAEHERRRFFLCSECNGVHVESWGALLLAYNRAKPSEPVVEAHEPGIDESRVVRAQPKKYEMDDVIRQGVVRDLGAPAPRVQKQPPDGRAGAEEGQIWHCISCGRTRTDPGVACACGTRAVSPTPFLLKREGDLGDIQDFNAEIHRDTPKHLRPIKTFWERIFR